MKQRSRFKWMLLAVGGAVAAIGLHHLAGNHAEPTNVAGQTGATVLTNAVAGESTAPATDVFRAAVLASFRETDPALRSVAFGKSFNDWFQHDPEAALDWLRQMPPGNEYTQGMFIALQAICKTDPQRALVLAAGMATTHEQKFVYHALFDQLAKDDLASAAGWLRSVPEGEARANALRTVADNWSGKDVSGALNWSKNLEDAGERTTATESILISLAVTDPQHTIDLASQNLEGGALDRVLEKSLKELAAENPQAAAEVVSKLPEGELQKNSAMAVARALAAQDPVAAVNWVQTLPADTQPVALNNSLDMWLRQDAVAAGKYVSEMPAGPAQDAAVSHLAENWATKDSAAAINWAESLSNASAQDAATISLASGWARIDPAAAVRWTAELPAENPARITALKGAYSYWEMADAAAAATYLGGLSETDRKAIKPETIAAK